jgi:hypothetical protein
MINLLPPTGLPLAPDAQDARTRREATPDFGAWLKQDKQPLPGATVPPQPEPVPPQPELRDSRAQPLLQDLPHLRADVLEGVTMPHHDLEAATPWRPNVEAPHPQIHIERPVPHADFDMPQARADFIASHPRIAQLLASAGTAATAPTPALPPSPRESLLAGNHVAELIDRPWHLVANAGLSYAHAQGQTPAPAAHAPILAGSFGPLLEGVLAGTPIAELLAILELPTHPRANSPAAHPGTPAHPEHDTDAARAERLERISDWMATHTDWPERLLRWFGNDAEIVAWVRDFQLGELELGELVQKIREYAQQQGRPLQRIFHNGREVWRAANSNDNDGSTS